MDEALPESFATYHEIGWIYKEIISVWIKKMIELSNHSANEPALLILDGHPSQVENAHLVFLAHEKIVILLRFLPQITHGLQLLFV